ncbi:MAG: hypothetical protein JKY70_12950, partial [Mucilaginibacter sp.]|nr:hypothetical protein [Mucilaginibacter sp.]
VIQPAIVGPGPRMFEKIALPATLKMELADIKVMQCGCVGLHYLKSE